MLAPVACRYSEPFRVIDQMYVNGSAAPAGSVAEAVRLIEEPSPAELGPLMARFWGATLLTVTTRPPVRYRATAKSLPVLGLYCWPPARIRPLASRSIAWTYRLPVENRPSGAK